MKIGIDIDGVVLDYEKGMLARAEIWDIEKCRGNGIIDNSKYFIQAKYDWTDEEKSDFVNENLAIVSEESVIMPGVKFVLNKLKEMGHELIIISARGIESNEMIDIVLRKFEKENIKFDKYYWKEKNKLKVCQDEQIDIMIDDHPITCKILIENEINTIYFRGIRGWNLEKSKYLKEVSNWGEIYRYIKDLK